MVRKCEFNHLIKILTMPKFNKRPHFSTYFKTNVWGIITTLDQKTPM